MDWTAQIDGYCERLGPGLLAEPANAVTNLAFVIVALWLWPRARGVERWLCAVLAVIGIGSGLFHTFATAWASLADVVPILLYILIYVYAANLRFWGWSMWVSALGAVLFVPYALAAGQVFAVLPGFAVSSFYWPVPLLIFVYAFLLRSRLPRVSAGLAIGTGILCASLVARSVDDALCPVLPFGTHFMWHLLNATMLGWMITVLRRHRLEPHRAEG
ncbi:hypothetical protein PARPLA_01300 [Rhodobacteraceae bacterium THAF1]|uniref:ceramidase domain-containing protein n=1 Tax=Palleronia sp. THAF1 TaxID=2587842 RepID=UPI000F4099DD|nr:ceramidase domain-containing protein [Palleronia sp. THAF1]QFU09517.1 hypothetical protein FIU81_12605 [Palleronia sp. THAF1]VDC21802.1 hypothetical protein PARPLA_01300 [Rhodobacteraceae bacterium THAF1]